MSIKRDPEKREPGHLYDMVDLNDRQILEIGCGEGRLTALYHQVVKHIVGIDLQFAALQTARNTLTNSVTFMMGDALMLPFRNRSFDAVIFAWSL